MANEIENALREIAAKVSHYVEKAATLEVTTQYVEIGTNPPPDFEHAPAAARTVITLDGDSFGVIPMRRDSNNNLVPDTNLLEMHQRSVTAATEYRARILNALLGLLGAQRS